MKTASTSPPLHLLGRGKLSAAVALWQMAGWALIASGGEVKGEKEMAEAVTGFAGERAHESESASMQTAPASTPEAIGAWQPLSGIWFSYYSAEISPSEAAKIAEIGRLAAQSPSSEFGIGVPSDKSGVEPNNAEVNQQRMSAIRISLNQQGIVSARIHIGSFGPNAPSVNRHIVIFTRR